LDQLKLAISGCVNELHEYAVPRQIITTTPANAMNQRLCIPSGALVDILFSPVLIIWRKLPSRPSDQSLLPKFAGAGR
jgi:hypothetical protein